MIERLEYWALVLGGSIFIGALFLWGFLILIAPAVYAFEHWGWEFPLALLVAFSALSVVPVHKRTKESLATADKEQVEPP